MGYYEILKLKKEPFSTSPDPDFFYESSPHKTALTRLEINIRLRRGLNLILGDVGTGKTTLLRTLLQNLGQDEEFILHMILDPTYQSEFQFLSSLVKIFGINPNFRSTMDYKEEIEKYLFRNGVDLNKTIVLFIDEAQKLTPANIELLRTLMNYETNDYKLLQLVLMAQMEILPKIKRIRNFIDRVSLKYIINPLDRSETKSLIEFRLRQAGFNSGRVLFTDDAVDMVYEASQGYPRRIALICHNALEQIVMHDKDKVDKDIIGKIIEREKDI
ncbi:MAG: transposase [Candidatus Omnitrophica bacterium CG07_land_8_20_14_0_80_42_15]|uniref:Transposase n=1 Tax=Candidatus Aquitaenariimonas noxiae TaxID=1974741 RepID=A0A2J0KXR5_9BACT|nr:MAG: transposase [Candidatus Omnitrophica bacterium CG07_land_8_20_14_0_80_42_15]